MRNLKKMTAVMLVCALQFSLTACGEQKETTAGASDSQKTQTAEAGLAKESTAEPVKESTAEPEETEILARYSGGAEPWGVPCLITLDNKGTMVITPGEDETYTDKYPASGEIKTVVIEEGITSIAGEAFQDYINLTSVSIPGSVSKIYKGAFENCDGLTEIAIPETVTVMEGTVFARCDSLTSAVIPDSVEELGNAMFSSCDSLTDVTLPSGLTRIPFGMFGFCKSLKSLTIPAGVTKIENEAFMGCEALTDIYFGGTEEQWNNMQIGENNEVLDTVTVHYGA